MSPSQTSGPVTHRLDALIDPLPADTFLRDYCGRQFLHVAGVPGRFAELFSWTDLNEILSLHRLGAPRLRLIRRGQALHPSLYEKPAVLSGNGVVLLASRVEALLRDGATLVIDEIEDAHRGLRECCVSLQDVFNVHVHANLYAGFGVDHAFAVHWGSMNSTSGRYISVSRKRN